MILRRYWLLASLLAIPLVWCLRPSAAQDKKPWQPPPTAFECRFTEKPIQIDGKADEDAWKDAQLIDNFYVPWLGAKARPARTATRAKLLWDREYLYFFADMEDADLYADVKEHDGMCWENDVFELFFKPADDKPGYYEFQVNAAGAILDMLIPRRGAGGYNRFKGDGKFHIDAKVKLRGTLNKWTDRDEGWSVEGKIPWKDFLRTGGRPAAGEKWKFALCRYDYSVDFEGPDLSTCAPLKTPPANFHYFEDYATLTFVGPAKSSAAKPHGIDKLIPVTTSRVVGSPDPPLPYRIRKVFAEVAPSYPIAVVHQPGSDRILFLDQSSSSGPTRLARFKDEPGAKDVETILSLTDVAYDLCFHPKFADNGYFYVGSNGADKKDAPKKCRITRYTMDRKSPYKVDPKSALVIIDWVSDGHNGAAVTFGHDGMLYITSGDGTSDSDTTIVGQDMTTLLAKVLRIDVDRPDPGKSYSVPKDNPFLKLPGARPEIWALGLRNPWRMTTDQKTGHIWVAQNGQDLWEQAYLVKRGDNYGWSVMEGSHPFYPNRKPGPLPFVKPTVEHHHSEARSLTGGIVYYGKRHPDLQGAYIYGDYSTGRVWGVKHDGEKILWHKELADTRLSITGFGTDSAGEIIICDHHPRPKGAFYTFDPTPKDMAPSIFPKKLSESGLFESVKGHVMKPGMIPYSVIAVLWSDGVDKWRWLYLPDGTTIEVTTNRGWNFPDGTVLVKSFKLNMEEGNADSGKWIETRFLTRQNGEWFGYSYAWNEEQTEAFLVESKGQDRDYQVKVAKSEDHPQGTKKLAWHYPSRAECMVCHSRAANWVLGLATLQMNKTHQYEKVADNQLRVLEHLGVLRINYLDEMRQQLRDEARDKGMSDKEIDRYVEEATATRGQRQTPGATSMLPRTPENQRKLVDPYDKNADLTLRARSYLHSNCSQCHVEAGGGNAMMDLEFTQTLAKMKIVGEKPQHHTFGIEGAKLIAPGDPERSVLLQRIAHRKEGFMPPLATKVPDPRAVELMREWILQMKK